jgi:hypothetical protein
VSPALRNAYILAALGNALQFRGYVTLPGTLYDLGDYPGWVRETPGAGRGIAAEVYEIRDRRGAPASRGLA